MLLETKFEVDILEVINMINEYHLLKRHLQLVVPKLHKSMFKNLTINYDVTIFVKYAGTKYWYREEYFQSRSTFSLLSADEIVQYSICPVLGKIKAQFVMGACPKHLQTPFGKHIKVSFFGTNPYITYKPIGGSDFHVMKFLAKKHKFIPKFVPEPRLQAIFPNGTKYGLIPSVRLRNTVLKFITPIHFTI